MECCYPLNISVYVLSLCWKFDGSEKERSYYLTRFGSLNLTFSIFIYSVIYPIYIPWVSFRPTLWSENPQTVVTFTLIFWPLQRVFPPSLSTLSTPRTTENRGAELLQYNTGKASKLWIQLSCRPSMHLGQSVLWVLVLQMAQVILLQRYHLILQWRLGIWLSLIAARRTSKKGLGWTSSGKTQSPVSFLVDMPVVDNSFHCLPHLFLLAAVPDPVLKQNVIHLRATFIVLSSLPV